MPKLAQAEFDRFSRSPGARWSRGGSPSRAWGHVSHSPASHEPGELPEHSKPAPAPSTSLSAVGQCTETMFAAKLAAAWAFGFSDNSRFTSRKCTGNVFTERTAAQWTYSWFRFRFGFGLRLLQAASNIAQPGEMGRYK